MDVKAKSVIPLLSDTEESDTELFVRNHSPRSHGGLPYDYRTSIQVNKQIVNYYRKKRRLFLLIVIVIIILTASISIIYAARKDIVETLAELDEFANFTEVPAGYYKNPAKPHIIFIVGDDIGWNDVGWRNPDMTTTNLDQLANGGVKFNNYYTYSTCSPSRAAFLTGYYSHRLGLQYRVIETYQTKHIPLNVPLLPEKLRELGYATHAIGKWHLGHCNWNYTPTYRGFDSFFGYRFATEDYYTHVVGDIYELWENSKPFFERNKTYSTDLFSERALRVINEHVEGNNNKPLYMYLAFQAIHGPTQESPIEYRVKTPPKIQQNVRKVTTHMLYGMDVAIGKVVQLLKENGLYDNTLIIYTSDNGGAVANGGNNYPLRGGKFTLWEGGSRVAAMAHGPMIQNPGRSFDGLFHAVDWLPTLLAAAGSPQDTAPSYDGIDQWEAIQTGVTSLKSRRDEIIYSVEGRGSAIRVGDYKLVFGDPVGDVWEKHVGKEHGSCIFSPYNGFVQEHCHVNLTDTMLFNVKQDESEYHNLAEVMPEVVKLMQRKLEAERKRAVPRQSEASFKTKAQPFIRDSVLYPGWC
jgi:arylsulfatase A-like enzyme